jgi:type IV pilus assembly protein PilQ
MYRIALNVFLPFMLPLFISAVAAAPTSPNQSSAKVSQDSLSTPQIQVTQIDSIAPQEEEPDSLQGVIVEPDEQELESALDYDEPFSWPADSDYDSEPLVSNIYYETEIREVLMDIAAQTGVNIVPGPMVQGYYVTAEFSDVPLEEALHQLLAPLGFTFTQMDGYYLVGLASPDSPSFSLLSTTERVVPNYIKAASVPKLLSSFYEPFIKVNAENNTVVISASPEMITRIKLELAKIDVPPRQVMIEALVTEFSEEARKSLGLEASWIGTKDGRGLSLSLPVGDLLDSTFSLWYLKPDAFDGFLGEYQISLKALVQDGEVQVRANPRVATLEGQKATIYVGREEYYVIVTGISQYSYGQLERIQVGVSLSIVPYVSDKNEITVEIAPEVSDVIGEGATGLPVVSKRAVTTKIRVKDGETIVIGGLLQTTEKLTQRKIPLLGDIPILGYFFSRTEKELEETETVIFITPHIMREATGE